MPTLSRLCSRMMAEQRLDRLERIAKLFVAAGLRMRRNMRELDEKIGIVIDFQIESRERSKEQDARINMLLEFQQRNEERFQRNEERFQRNEERFQRTEEQFQRLAESQANADRRMDKLAEIVRDNRKGK